MRTSLSGASRSSSRVLAIGLDCAAPRFIFGSDAFDLPNLRSLMHEGCWGKLRSCDPPITVPAWSCMMSGKDPGTLGIYGFRNRANYSYDAMSIATGAAVQEDRVWDVASRAERDVVVIGVPQTWPVRAVRGCLLSGMLTPGTDAEFTYPPELASELREQVGEYLIDVPDFRTDEKEGLVGRIHELMNNRFDVAAYLMRSKPWDFFMMVEMGVDRLHHAFWQYADPEHPLYDPESGYEDVIEEYYLALDRRIGALLEVAGDDTTVMVVSDHGAQPLMGGFCINRWLEKEGYLVLKEPLAGPTPFSADLVDWSRTRAWGEGGYYGRVHLNLRGREPQGLVEPSEVETLRNGLIQEIEALECPNKGPMGNRVLKPEDIYANVNGIAPDLIAYFGELRWRSIGLLGCSGIFSEGNDTGPDGANHDFEGIFIMRDRAAGASGEVRGLGLLDIAPTIIDRLGMRVPDDMQGTPLRTDR